MVTAWAPAALADEEEEEDRVVVTGSRLTNQFASDAPIDVISVQEAALEGVSDIASLLRTQTVAMGSPQVTAVTSSIFVQDGGIGAETISLRGLGANRTLTLLNGRRAGPAGTRGAVSAFDLNVIPLSAIDRIEILKDGASSVYGSDAVAGVVNLITKQGGGGDFNVFYSQPEESGGEEFSVDASWGKDFDRGWFRITGSYYDQTTLLNGERDYFACGQDYVFDLDTGERADFIDPRTGQPACSDLAWGHVWTYDYTNPGFFPSPPWQARPALLQYDYDGDLGNYIPELGPAGGGLVVPPGFYPVAYGELLLPGATPDAYYGPFAEASEGVVNADHPFQNQQSLIPEIERTTGFFNGEFDLTPSVTAYGEVLLNRRKTTVSSYRQFWTYQYVYNYGAPFIGGDPLALAAGFSGTLIGLSPTPPTDHADDRITVDYGRVLGGFRGDFGTRAPSWTWDVHGQFSRSEGEYDADIIFDDAISPYQFRNSLCAGTTTPVRGVPCVDIDWYAPAFLNGQFTDEERDFLFGTAAGETIYEQWNIDGSVQGDLFELPAGVVSAALGFQYREDEIDDQPAQAILDGNAWGQSTADATVGEQSTTAYFGEIGVPIIADKPFAESIDLTASVRYTEIESNGPVQGVDTTVTDESTTYKIGAGWQVTPALRFRSTYGTSFRSPALFELFLGNETSFLGQRQIDPCVNWQSNLDNGAITQRIADNCAADGIPGNHLGAGASATIFSRGGAMTNLQSETSDATTVGFVWTPGFADLQIAVDYFEFEIKDEVTQLGAANILIGCYDSETFATEPLCNLFERNPPPVVAGDPPAFLVSTIQDDFVNVATQTNRGIDFELLYRTEVPFGSLTIGTQQSYQIEDEIILLPNSDPLDTNGEAGDPKWVGDLDLTLDRGPWSIFYGLRYVSNTSNVESYGDQPQTYFGQPVAYRLQTESITYHNASVSRELPHGLQLRVGVSNIFDEHPPAVTVGSDEFDVVGTSAFYSQYDWLGRRAFINLSGSF